MDTADLSLDDPNWFELYQEERRLSSNAAQKRYRERKKQQLLKEKQMKSAVAEDNEETTTSVHQDLPPSPAPEDNMGTEESEDYSALESTLQKLLAEVKSLKEGLVEEVDERKKLSDRITSLQSVLEQPPSKTKQDKSEPQTPPTTVKKEKLSKKARLPDGTPGSNWNNFFSRLPELKDADGTYDLRKVVLRRDPQFYNWLHTTKSRYARGLLNEERKRELDNIRFTPDNIKIGPKKRKVESEGSEDDEKETNKGGETKEKTTQVKKNKTDTLESALLRYSLGQIHNWIWFKKNLIMDGARMKSLQHINSLTREEFKDFLLGEELSIPDSNFPTGAKSDRKFIEEMYHWYTVTFHPMLPFKFHHNTHSDNVEIRVVDPDWYDALHGVIRSITEETFIALDKLKSPHIRLFRNATEGREGPCVLFGPMELTLEDETSPWTMTEEESEPPASLTHLGEKNTYVHVMEMEDTVHQAGCRISDAMQQVLYHLVHYHVHSVQLMSTHQYELIHKNHIMRPYVRNSLLKQRRSSPRPWHLLNAKPTAPVATAPSSTCSQFQSDQAYGFCDDGSNCQLCPSTATSPSGTSSTGTSSGAFSGHGSSCSWSSSYTVTPTGPSTYNIIPSDTTQFSTETIQQYGDHRFSISNGLLNICSGSRPNDNTLSIVYSNGCHAVLNGGSGIVVANISLIVAAMSALLVM
ncbi:hypothetical protein PROFUN_10045 [Planoprotostelium fungivorum]|uniref:Uncharacterized protein n=1 Tax=Planoprotostelium fungivorum TaxID=1890364 RepID=A0A2P6NFH6_9EUKA|nr:hypothetical protein PROFUN_10045 [Planoprotostelium fungivorum]